MVAFSGRLIHLSDAPIVKWRRSPQRPELFVYDPIGAGAVGAVETRTR